MCLFTGSFQSLCAWIHRIFLKSYLRTERVCSSLTLLVFNLSSLLTMCEWSSSRWYVCVKISIIHSPCLKPSIVRRNLKKWLFIRWQFNTFTAEAGKSKIVLFVLLRLFDQTWNCHSIILRFYRLLWNSYVLFRHDSTAEAGKKYDVLRSADYIFLLVLIFVSRL